MWRLRMRGRASKRWKQEDRKSAAEEEWRYNWDLKGRYLC